MNNDRYNFTAASTKLSESTSLKTRVSLVCMHSASVRKRWMLVAEFVGVSERRKKKKKKEREREKKERVTIMKKITGNKTKTEQQINNNNNNNNKNP